jgi:hypothetical protein
MVIMYILPGETILYGSPEAGFVITSHRIRIDSKSWGQAQVTSIMLEELCSAEVKYSSQPLLFVLAFLLLLLGGASTIWAYTRQVSGILSLLRLIPLCSGMLLALGLVFIYFMSRRLTLVLASAGASIVLDGMRLGMETTRQLIDTIESAKDYRFTQGGVVNPEFQQGVSV